MHFSMVKKMKFFQIFWDSQIFLGFYRFTWLQLLNLTMSSKRPKSILWVFESISRLCLTHWDKFGGHRRHSKMNFEAGKFTFRWSKKMKIFQILWDSQILLGFYRFAWLQLLKLTMSSKRPKSILWVPYLKVSPDFA